jgi:general secretion pathway protein D
VFGSNPTQQLSAFQTIAANPLGLASLLGLSGALRGPTLEGTEDFIRGGIPSVGVLLQALKSTNDVNVISTPHLLTMDNEEAEIKVNEKRPFPTGLGIGGLGGLQGLANQAGATGQAGALGGLGGVLGGLGLGTTLNREDVGLTLKLKPQINDQSSVRLELDQELSDVAGIDQVTGQVITSNRAAKTVVVVGDQESVVIGGLVRDRESTDESKIPILGDIPLLGWLFKRQQTIAEKVNLILVLTPYIIRGPEDFRRIYERKMQERRDFIDAFYGESTEYRAAIDWDRKLGVLAKFRQGVAEEMQKAENDGPGSGDDLIIRPEDGVEETLELDVPARSGAEGLEPDLPPPPAPAELVPDLPPLNPAPVE